MSLYIGDTTVNDLRCGGELVNRLWWCNQLGQLVEVWRRSMEWVEVTESVDLAAPSWAAWLDIVVLGAGGGGSGGNNSNANGNGGASGRWGHSTFDMIPGRDLSIVIGQGGGGGAGGSAGAGSAGGDTVASTSFNNWSVRGLGGAGGTGTGGAAGKSPGEWIAYLRSFVGGAAQAATEAAGNDPGGGGGPGKGATIYGAKAGGPGGRGRAWYRWRSY